MPTLEARKQAFTQFILSLSDQQLVTGLAILVAGLTTWNKERHTTRYELGVLSGLALFSSTTHMATLSALRTYFKRHRSLRNVRACGMVAILLIVYVSVFIPTKDPPCQWTDSEGKTWETTLNKFYEPWDAVTFMTALLPFEMLLWGYIIRIGNLYTSNDNWRNPTRNQRIELLATASAISREQYFQVCRALSRSILLRMSLRMPSDWIQKYTASVLLVDRAYLSCLMGVAFSFSYSTSKVAFGRWYYAPNVSAETNSMGFGQIMAVFLLVLPFLTAGETYIGMFYQHTHTLASV